MESVTLDRSKVETSTMDTFLPPIEKPKGLMMKPAERLGFRMANRQFRCFPRRNPAGNFTDGIKSAALQQARGNG